MIKTPPKSARLLPGITRDLVVELAIANGMKCEEANFSRPELFAADEIWLTSSTKEVIPVVTLNEEPVGNGKPGDITRRIYHIYQDYKEALRRSDD